MDNEFTEKTKVKNAYCEVLEILKYISVYDYIKIPKRIIKKFNENSNKDYQFKYDPSKTLDEQNVSKLTKKIILILYRDYWATDTQKKEFIEKVQNISVDNYTNQIEHNKNILVNTNNKKIENSGTLERTDLVVRKKNTILRKIFEKLKRLFL